MKTILITGATGKIGSIITKNFLDHGDCVIAISRTEKNLSNLKKNTCFFVLEISK